MEAGCQHLTKATKRKVCLEIPHYCHVILMLCGPRVMPDVLFQALRLPDSTFESEYLGDGVNIFNKSPPPSDDS